MSMTPTRRKQWTAATLLLATAGIALWWIPRAGNAQKESPPSAPGTEQSETPTIPVTLFVASEKESPHYLEATGTVRPEFETALAAKVMGRVQDVAGLSRGHVEKAREAAEVADDALGQDFLAQVGLGIACQ